MTKSISFPFAAVSDRDVQLVKLYPEGDADARFKVNCVSGYMPTATITGCSELKYSVPGRMDKPRICHRSTLYTNTGHTTWNI